MDKKTLQHIAELSRIKLSEKELEKFTPQMQTILDSADELQKVNTKEVSPMKRHVSFDALREDKPEDSLTQQEVLKNANYKQNGYIKIYGELYGSIEES